MQSHHKAVPTFQGMIEEALRSGGWRSAEVILRKEIGENPGNHLAYYLLGVRLSENGDRNGAVENIREAIRLDPKNREYRHILAGLMKVSAIISSPAPRRKSSRPRA